MDFIVRHRRDLCETFEPVFCPWHDTFGEAANEFGTIGGIFVGGYATDKAIRCRLPDVILDDLYKNERVRCAVAI